MKANATVLRDSAISENYMDGKQRKEKFEAAYRARNSKPKWDIPVPDDFKSLLGKQPKFRRCFNKAYRNKCYAEMEKENTFNGV